MFVIRSFSSFSLDDSGKLANASDLSVTGENFIRRTSSTSLQADERKWSVLSAEEVFASVLVVVRDDGSPV
ncbi:hypothetical protein T12_11372, partial [Trichinella patagoniensis]